MGNSAGKILVIRGGAIGDFILTLPVLTALRLQFPDVAIEVLGYRHIVQLARAGGLADAVHNIEAATLSGFFARGGTLDTALQDYFGGFALIVSYLYDPDEIFHTNVARCSKAQFIAGPHRPQETGLLHATDVFLRPLERLAIFDADPVPRLKLSGTTNHPRKTLALHPGSGSESKNWPEASWAELMKLLLQESDYDLLLVGGEAEGNRLERLAGNLPPERVCLAHNLSLCELAQELAECVGFAGHDSGITHLAAALELRTLVLWGPSVESVWRPRSERVNVVVSPSGLGNLSARRVATELSHWIFQGRVA